MTMWKQVIFGFAAVAAVSGAPLLQAQGDEPIVVPFSDPSRPGKVIVEVFSGGITVRGENRRDVAIQSNRGAERPIRRPRRQGAPDTGMRRLTQVPGFSVEEERNEIKVEGNSPLRPGGGTFELRVPTRTSLKLEAVNDGTITVENVEGDLEIENVNGPVVLTNVSGTVVATSVNGGVKAQLTRVTAQKAMAFSSLNGNVDVTLPASIRANVKMRSDQGDVFSDFDVQLRPDTGGQSGRRAGGKYRIEVNRSIFGAVNGGGPEIELRTFNGSVYLRKGAQ